MKTIADLFDSEHNRGPAAQEKLIEAYQDVFSGNADAAQAEIVLVDILKVCGYYHTTLPGVSSVELHEAEGGRRVAAAILQRLSVDLETLRSAGRAVGRESRVDVQKGQL